MNFLRRFIQRGQLSKESKALPKNLPAEKSNQETPYPAMRISDVLCVTEVGNAEFFVGDLFRRRFNTTSFPDFPRHFVAFYKVDNHVFMPVGYVHHTPWENCYLCGGLVIDERFYRQIPSAHRQIIRSAGGVAEYLQRESFAVVGKDALAIWGYVGDKLAEKVDLRVGFVHTELPYRMVVWLKPLSPEAEKALLQKVEALGPF